MQLSDLGIDDPRWAAALPVLQELRPHLDAASLRAVHVEGEPQGYRFLGAFTEDGTCLGVAGWRLLATVNAGRKLYVDDLVTTASSAAPASAPRCWPSSGGGRAGPAARYSTWTPASSGTTRTASTSARGCTSPRTTSGCGSAQKMEAEQRTCQVRPPGVAWFPGDLVAEFFEAVNGASALLVGGECSRAVGPGSA